MSYDYIYHPSTLILYDIKKKQEYDLNIEDHLLLMIFIKKGTVKKEELESIMHSEIEAIRTRKCRLCQRTGIKIKSKSKYGYKLVSKIREEKQWYLK